MEKNRYRAAEPAHFRAQDHGYNVAQQHTACINRAEADEKSRQTHSRLRKKPFAAPDVGDDLDHTD